MDDEDEEDKEEEDITVGSPMIGELLHSRCHAHIANLLLKDLGKEFKIIPTIDSIKPVLKEFNKPNWQQISRAQEEMQFECHLKCVGVLTGTPSKITSII